MKHAIYNTKGTKEGDIQLPESVFGVSWNADLMHQILVSYQANARVKVSKTKDRSEVRGADKKPWRQKGTGRARHGSIYSPIWRGGGVTHGPVAEKIFGKKINTKMRRKALAVALSQKVRDEKVIFLNALELSKPQTAQVIAALKGLSKVSGFERLVSKKKNATLVVVPEKTEALDKSFRNLGNVYLKEARNISPVDVMKYTHTLVVGPEKVVDILSARLTGDVDTKKEDK